jgi:hypothetical protein
MPRIPVYDTQQVQLQGITAPQIGSMPSSGLQELGRGISNLGASIEKVQAEADQIRAEEAFNKLRESQNKLGYDQKDGAFNVKGGNVFNRDSKQAFSDEYLGRLDAEAQAIMGGLGNDRQKAYFQRAAGRARLEFGGQLQRHEAQQGEVYREGVFKGVLSSEREHVAQNYNDPDSVAQSIGRVKANTKSYAMAQGLPPDQQDMAVKEATSAMHVTVMERMLEGNKDKGLAPDPVGAKQYYQEAIKSGELLASSKEAKAMRSKIEADERSILAAGAVDAVWKGFGPDDDTEAVNLDAMAVELRGQFKNDPEGLKVAMADLKERASMHDYSVRQREASVTGGIFERVIAGETLASIRRSPEFRSLDGVRQLDMITKIESFQKRGNEGDDMTKFAEYWAVASNPEKLSKMSDAEIFAMAPKIGQSMVKQLLTNKQQLIKGDDKVIAATIDNDQFKFWAGQGGIEVNPKKGSDDEKLLGELKFRVESMIDDQQRQLGRPLQRKEKDDIMKRMIVEVPVSYKQNVFGVTRTGVMTKRLFEVQSPENIVIQGQDREAVVRALKNVGIQNPTEAQIREGYVRLKAQ